MKPSTKTVLSGIRATGKLHLGNFIGALSRFSRMSADPQYACFFFVADMHTLTTLKGAAEIRENLPNIILDYLAAGVDPERSTIYVQSSVPQVAELMWYLACLTNAKELSDLPNYKDKVLKQPEDNNAGLLTYPVLMAADILGPRADFVPVGKDQKPHLELTQKLAKKFNALYGDYFPVPDELSSEMVLIPGLGEMDERGGFPKMGKSEGNTINLSDTPEQTWDKIRVSPTDPQRARRNDPGDPSHCAIFALHQHVSTPAEIAWSQKGCTSASIGCLECKKVLSDNVNESLSDFRQQRKEFAQHPEIVSEVLEAGRKRADVIFSETVATVRERMGITSF
jgi:tryptophanyl-tRNA synthetase